eukprot:TRINITY_DN3949_c0_g1_i4.p1 TRINITY_DN3949_c0_g1~~TRINITY_DN3949_c0_g1_i4.p1  ORF type:complete len:302 (+),score=55.61 TRINITY_DN3949_c0_g1_i4:320-1225(+)
MLAAITAHLAHFDGTPHAAAWAARATCTRLRNAVAVGLGPHVALEPVGRLSSGTPVVKTAGGRRRSVLVTPFPDLPNRTARLRRRVAAAAALLTPPSGVRELTIYRAPAEADMKSDRFDMASGGFAREIAYDPGAFAGTGVLGPLLVAAGRLPLRSLTVGPLCAEVVSLAVAPGCWALNTLRSLRLCRLASATTWVAPVRTTLTAVSPRLVDLLIEFEVATHVSEYPGGGAVGGRLGGCAARAGAPLLVVCRGAVGWRRGGAGHVGPRLDVSQTDAVHAQGGGRRPAVASATAPDEVGAAG